MTSAPALPPGWRNWPEDALAELLAGLQSLADERASGRGPWLCDRSECDGLPHPGRRNKHARTEQRAPATEWDYWNLFAGRGFGKTRTGAEWVIGKARHEERGALVGPTAADVRDIMVEGESGILACARAGFRPEYQPSKRRLVYPNGAMQFCYSADEPERLRGPQHHYAWADELAAWRYLQYAWDMLSMGMRLGDHPQVCTTTTPRPLPLIKWLKASDRAVTVSGSTYANLHNLAPTFARTVVDRYAGTTLGRQELDAEILEDLPGALVRRLWIERSRVPAVPALDLKVVSVDPAGTGTGDEAGILVLGRGTADQHAYVLADYSGHLTARETGLRAWKALYEHDADVLVYEDNYGKQWLRDGLVNSFADYHGLTQDERDAIMSEDAAVIAMAGEELYSVFDSEKTPVPNPYRYLRKVTAQQGKTLRAQPMAMRYEQGKVHHVGSFPKYEDQLTTWNPHSDKPKERESPDRIDAAVHGVTYLLGREKSTAQVVSPHAVGLETARRRSGVHPLERMRRRPA
jgi:phage terminase large subunit-like protein